MKMKKSIAALALTLVLGASMAVNTLASSYIGEAKAKDIALSSAGVTASEASIDKVVLYRDGKSSHTYELVFHTSSHKYIYKVDAGSGEVKLSKEIGSSNVGYTGSVKQPDNLIGSDKALSISLEYAGISEADLLNEKVKLDFEDQTWIYEVELETTSGAEYELEINALTGAILSYEADVKVKTAGSATGTGTIISADKAMSTAMSNANISSTSIKKQEVKLDTDDHVLIYKIEIKTYSGNKYEYKIDAYTGAIIESKIK